MLIPINTNAAGKVAINKKKATIYVGNSTRITAKAAGKTTITVAGADRKTYKCVITVKNLKETHIHKYSWDG